MRCGRPLFLCARRLLDISFGAVLLLLTSLDDGSTCVAADNRQPDVENGRKLFGTIWTPMSKEGRGLGPVFNDRSCVACHSLGGEGGGGLNKHNVDLLTVVVPDEILRNGADGVEVILQQRARDAYRLKAAGVHIGLASEPTILLHRFGNDSDYRDFRRALLGWPKVARSADVAGTIAPPTDPDEDGPIETLPHAELVLQLSHRNSTALFGAGLIDSLTYVELQSQHGQQSHRSPEITGRYVGRFGWRGQVTDLEQFVRLACSDELGLQIDGIAEPVNPIPLTATARRTGKIPGVPPPHKADLPANQVRDLTAFIAALPRPEQRIPSAEQGAAVQHGRRLFDEVGCADCHRPSLGKVEGIYSDLLLHDMGPSLRDPQPAPVQAFATAYYAETGRRRTFEPSQLSEWKTPPLWGVADSAPYLHDGRAATLDDAILWHGGEAKRSIEWYRGRSQAERDNLLLFLSMLVAPQSSTSPAKLDAGPIDEDERVAAARLRLAETAYTEGKLAIARQWLQAVVNDFPDTKTAQVAKIRLTIWQ